MKRRIPLRKRMLVRLLIASVLIAVCSVAATAWLAVETTTRALREEQGQDLADDMRILARLSGYAATHPDWNGVDATVRTLAASTGRRIALTTADRTLIADSARKGTSLPLGAAATSIPCTPTPTPSPARSSTESTPVPSVLTGSRRRSAPGRMRSPPNSRSATTATASRPGSSEAPAAGP